MEDNTKETNLGNGACDQELSGQQENEIPAGAEADSPEETNEKLLQEYKQKSDVYFNRLIRLQADFENYKKRIAREKEESYYYIAGEILTPFLDVVDNLERATATVPADGQCTSCQQVVQGLNMVLRQFKDLLTRFEVEEIPALGEVFDPNVHHAVMQAEDTDADEGTIVDVFQKGYRLRSRVLRPSMVKVAK
jgi:molecular chaperone GrpE